MDICPMTMPGRCRGVMNGAEMREVALLTIPAHRQVEENLT